MGSALLFNAIPYNLQGVRYRGGGASLPALYIEIALPPPWVSYARSAPAFSLQHVCVGVRRGCREGAGQQVPFFSHEERSFAACFRSWILPGLACSTRNLSIRVQPNKSGRMFFCHFSEFITAPRDTEVRPCK